MQNEAGGEHGLAGEEEEDKDEGVADGELFRLHKELNHPQAPAQPGQ